MLGSAVWPLTLATLAGLSTTAGALAAVIVKPSQSVLAGLLGSALGVMATVSIVELVIRNAMESDAFLVCAAALGGGLAYYVLEPLFPKMEEDTHHKHSAPLTIDDPTAHRVSHTAHPKSKGSQLTRVNTSAISNRRSGEWPEAREHMHEQSSSSTDEQIDELTLALGPVKQKQTAAGLMRLGLLMAFTMTLHNLPEGFAVAFSAFTDFGPIMAVAIAVHNIPEGIIVAAPIYAATGSRWKAVGLATASGLSEPLGALISLAAFNRYITEERLHYLLAFVGGVMLAVCGIELWPEGRSCKDDRALLIGILVGTLIMGWTLFIGV